MSIDLSKFSNPEYSRGRSLPVELAWHCVRLWLFLLPVPVPSVVRRVVLRLFGARIGGGVVIRSGVDISMPWRLVVEDNVWIGSGVCMLTLAEIHIESNVCVSQQVFLCTGSHRFDKETFDLIVKPIRIESGCWLAARAFVAPGVTIGQDSFVTAQSVVCHSVPARSKVTSWVTDVRPLANKPG